MDEFAAALEVASPKVVEAPWGKSYEVADKIAAMPLLKFAHLSKKGVDSADMEGLAAIYDLLRAVFTDDAWERFEIDSTEERANDEDLMQIITKAIEVIAARPTKSPSDSSDGQSTTTASSTEPSSFAEYKASLGLRKFELRDLAS